MFLYFALRNGEDRLIRVSSDGKLNSMPFTVVDDLGLIGGAIGSEGGDSFSLGPLPDTVRENARFLVAGATSPSLNSYPGARPFSARRPIETGQEVI